MFNSREDDFDNAFDLLHINEGDFSDDPDDAGKRTIFGITERDYPLDFEKVYFLYKNGQKNLALLTAKNFYKKTFWNNLYKEIPDSSLSFKIFDLSVNRGTTTAIKLLQRTLYYDFKKTIKIDGKFGQITLGAIKSISSQELLYEKYIKWNEESYKSLSKFWKFGRGWLNRLFRRHTI